jgi:hypothetical protein
MKRTARTSELALALCLSSLSPNVLARPDFGMDPEVESSKLEKGNFAILGQIKLRTGTNVLAFFKKHEVFVAPALSDVACSEKQINYLMPGCSVLVQVTNGHVKHLNECGTILRCRRISKNGPFLPDNGWAKAIDENPSSFLAVLKDNELRCDKVAWK